MTYDALDPTTVAALVAWHTEEFKFAADDDLNAAVAHADLIFDVARYECEIEHPTEWLDSVHAERCAAVSVLARRSECGYSIDRERPVGFDRGYLEDLKMRAPVRDIVEAAGAELYRRGRGWTARCPFPGHEDRYPSFYIYEDTNSAFCFGCRRGGDAYEVVMLLEDIDFPAAVRKVASRIGEPVLVDRRPTRIRLGLRNVS